MILEKHNEKVDGNAEKIQRNGKTRLKESHAKRHTATRSKSRRQSNGAAAFASRTSSSSSYGSAGHQHAPIHCTSSSPLFNFHDYQQVITSNNQTFLSKYGGFGRVAEFPMPVTQVHESPLQHTLDTMAKNKIHDFQQNEPINTLNEVVSQGLILNSDINCDLSITPSPKMEIKAVTQIPLSECSDSSATTTVTNTNATKPTIDAAVVLNDGDTTQSQPIQCGVSDALLNRVAVDSVDHIHSEVANKIESSPTATSTPEDAQIAADKARSILKKPNALFKLEETAANLEQQEVNHPQSSASKNTSRKNVRFAEQLCEVTSYTLPTTDQEEVPHIGNADENATRITINSRENGCPNGSFGRIIRPLSAAHFTSDIQPHAPRATAQINLVESEATTNGNVEKARLAATYYMKDNVVSNVLSRASVQLPAEICLGVSQFGPPVSERLHQLAHSHTGGANFLSSETNCTTPTNGSHTSTYFQQYKALHPPPQETRLAASNDNEEYNLQKNPTEQEIDWLWEKVRSCLNRKVNVQPESVQETSELSTSTSSARISVPMSAQLIDGTSLLPTSRIYQTRVGGHGVRVVHHLVSSHQRRVALLRHREQAFTPNVSGGRFRNSMTSATQRDTKKDNSSEAVSKNVNDNLSTEQNYHYNVSQNTESVAAGSASSSMTFSSGSNDAPYSSLFPSSRRGVMLKARQQTQPPFLNLYSPHPPSMLSPRQRLFSASNKIRSNTPATQYFIDEP